jgi:acyl-CoA dehydrogenase
VARQVLREHRAAEGMWPTGWLPGRIEAARAQYADLLELEVGNL